jgi:uncharacterized membrane protein YczE
LREGIYIKHFLIRFARLLLGLFLLALGKVFTIQANVGYIPWDVLHAGLSITTGITIGTASIIVGLVLVIVAAALKEKLGLGTLLNMLLVGLFVDLILGYFSIPVAKNFAFGIVMLVVGLLIFSFATFFYISSGFGAGPRDCLMVALNRITKRPVGVCRGVIEVLAVASGWLLGGHAGAGTVIFAFGVGFCIQIVFHLFKFDVSAVKQETLWQTVESFKKELK